MNNRVNVYVADQLAGYLIKNETNYEFIYDETYLLVANAKPVSLTLPVQAAPFRSELLFPFFDGLAQEGWLKEMSERILHIDAADRFSLLIKNGNDCIGNVSIREIK